MAANDAASNNWPTQLLGRVVGIADGDTLTILDDGNQQFKVRLAGIDAPERGQPFGQTSKQSLSDLVFGSIVQSYCNKLDKYGRWVCLVVVDGKDANLEQVRRGLAWHYKEYQSEQSAADRESYADAEHSARDKHVGLWSEASPTPPWEWRAASRR
jgi:endonuclease YncB( thermonuclease family)